LWGIQSRLVGKILRKKCREETLGSAESVGSITSIQEYGLNRGLKKKMRFWFIE
jgi:hypothetical protein